MIFFCATLSHCACADVQFKIYIDIYYNNHYTISILDFISLYIRIILSMKNLPNKYFDNLILF